MGSTPDTCVAVIGNKQGLMIPMNTFEGKHVMKKLLPLIALSCLAQSALAANNINNLNIGQTDFHNLSEDLGSALSYKPVTPSTTLGITGFDIGIDVTQTQLAKSAYLWPTITGSSTSINNLYIPKLYVEKGLPFGFDIGGFYSAVPNSNIKLWGGELRYAILDGGLVTPTIGVRAAYTKLTGVSILSLDTRSVDISISKGIALLTPYAGAGVVWTNSTANGVPTLTGESFSQNKVYAGANLNLGLGNIAAEWDRTGSANSYSIKLGFRF